MLDVQSKIQGFKLIANDERYLIKYNEDYFYISELFYSILHEIKTGTHKVDEFIKKYEISTSDYEELSDLLSDKVDDIIGDETKKKKYIRFSIPLLSEKNTTTLSKYLAFFFAKNLFRILFPLVILVAIGTVTLINTEFSNHSIFDISLLDTFLVYAVIMVIMFFHELGHSSASKHYDINPKEIGFGFYIILPVLYSNVTRVWELDRNKRVTVNLAGVYFQGMVNLLAFLYLAFYAQDNYLTYLVILITKSNLFVMAYSMFPFVRNDGYWIISDYFNILNLNKRSYPYIIELIQRKEPLNYSLLLYSIGQYAFIYYLCSRYVPNIPSNVRAFINYVTENGLIELIQNELGLLFKLIISLLIGMAAISSLFRFFKPVFKPKKIEAKAV